MWISTYTQKDFKTSHKYSFKIQSTKANSVKIPNFGDCQYDDSSKEGAFASNLVTNDDFSNIFHEDNDFNSCTCGIWTPIPWRVSIHTSYIAHMFKRE